MRIRSGVMGSKRTAGFTVIEILVALVVLGILGGLSIKPANAFIQKLRLQNAAQGMKQYLLNARVRAVSNPNRHCGVAFFIHADKPTVNDTLIAFFDKSPTDDTFTKGQDSLYSSPYVIAKLNQLAIKIDPNFPGAVVFRGDGSANASLKAVLSMGAFVDTVHVLASTGKVKVIAK